MRARRAESSKGPRPESCHADADERVATWTRGARWPVNQRGTAGELRAPARPTSPSVHRRYRLRGTCTGRTRTPTRRRGNEPGDQRGTSGELDPRFSSPHVPGELGSRTRPTHASRARHQPCARRCGSRPAENAGIGVPPGNQKRPAGASWRGLTGASRAPSMTRIRQAIGLNAGDGEPAG
jgi:hypothetical protein